MTDFTTAASSSPSPARSASSSPAAASSEVKPADQLNALVSTKPGNAVDVRDETLPGTFLSTLVPSAAVSFAVQLLFGIPSVIYSTDITYDLAGGMGFYTTLATAFLVPVLRRRERERERARARNENHSEGRCPGQVDAKTEAALEHDDHCLGNAKTERLKTPNGTGISEDGEAGLFDGLSLTRDWDWRQVAITCATLIWALRREFFRRKPSFYALVLVPVYRFLSGSVY